MSLLSAVLQEASKSNTDDYKKLRDIIFPKVKEVNERIQMLAWDLQHIFIDTHLHFTTTKSLEQINFKNRYTNIVNDHKTLLEDITSLKNNHDVKDDEFQNYCAKLNNSFEQLNELYIVTEGTRVLERANHEFNRFNYIDAMTSVSKLKQQLQSLKFEGNLAKALSNLYAQAENQYAIYAAQLSIEWDDLFTWSEKKGLNFLTYSLSVQQSDPILIQKVLKSLYVTERMNAELVLFSHFFIDQLLHNIIRHNCDIFTEDHIGALIFNIKIDLKDPKKPNYQTVFNNLTAVFEFLQSTLGSHFECDKAFLEVFSGTIQEKFFSKVINEIIRINLPACDSSYNNFKNIVIELDAFNKFLIELKFVKAEESPLNKYIDDTECVLYNKKCDKLLSDVRTLLMESLSHGTIVVGSPNVLSNESMLDATPEKGDWDINKPMFLPRCVISRNVKTIVTLITEHLEESTKLPERYCNQLVSYIKDISVMYQSIVPKKFKVNLECCPSDIALFFNNCFYLAHSLIGPPWCQILPHQLSQKLTLVLLENIQDLRVLGLEKVSLYLQSKKNTIMKSVQCTDSTQWSEETYEMFDTAIKEAISLMIDLKSYWYNVLPTRMFEMALCTLIEVLCQSILDKIFADTKPVSEHIVYLLALRVEDTQDEIKVFFEEPIELESKINVWSKFTKLPLLLKAQLLEISELWNKQKDQFQGYTCEEVRQIIKMRFPDDKYRLRILKEIQ